MNANGPLVPKGFVNLLLRVVMCSYVYMTHEASDIPRLHLGIVEIHISLFDDL